MHYYQFHIGDYSSHTSRLSKTEDLAYRRMLDFYYLNERPLNGCSTNVARDIGMLEEKTEVEYILEKFFHKKDDCWVNNRAEMEINAYNMKLKTASKAGKASAKARKLKASERVLDSVDTEKQRLLNSVEPTINHKPLTSNHKPSKDSSSAKAKPCPIQKIVDLYNKTVNYLPATKVLADLTKKNIGARWKSDEKFQKMKFWAYLFKYCEDNEFLSGRSQGTQDRKPFRASLDWIVKPSNFAKIVNSNYDES